MVCTPAVIQAGSRLFRSLEEGRRQRPQQHPCKRRQAVEDVGADAAGTDGVGRQTRSLLCGPPLHLQYVQHIAQLRARVLCVPASRST
jgi:hypothetical protein